jgi:hypothetical protein
MVRNGQLHADVVERVDTHHEREAERLARGARYAVQAAAGGRSVSG